MRPINAAINFDLFNTINEKEREKSAHLFQIFILTCVFCKVLLRNPNRNYLKILSNTRK